MDQFDLFSRKISTRALSENIRSIRIKRGISQTELADKSGINLKSISRYELGKSIPPANVLKGIANILGVSTDALLGDSTTNIKDKDLLRKFEVIQEMEDETKSMIINFIDMAIRDFKAKQEYFR